MYPRNFIKLFFRRIIWIIYVLFVHHQNSHVPSAFQHRVPREYHDRGPRINLTFRVIYPE